MIRWNVADRWELFRMGAKETPAGKVAAAAAAKKAAEDADTARNEVLEHVSEELKKKDELLATFNKHLHNKYDRYFQTFIGCEILNLIILASQVTRKNKTCSQKIYQNSRC